MDVTGESQAQIDVKLTAHHWVLSKITTALDNAKMKSNAIRVTLRDAKSRFILCIKLLRRQSDNGAPFASVNGRGGLTNLSAWFLSSAFNRFRFFRFITLLVWRNHVHSR
jgi:hypothetical protein